VDSVHNKSGQDILQERFGAIIQPSHRTYHTAVPQDYWQTQTPGSLISPINYQTSNGVEITLSESNFTDLCYSIESLVFHPRHSWESEYIKKLEFEAKIRDNNPAVMKAYNNYKILMVLVANGQHLVE